MNRFDTLLVANRGEIACRIIESARKLGLRTVAVFSEADRGAKHVRLADEAVLLGPAPAKESYLRIDAILAAAASTGAGAIHPGYGFLSEDAAFAEAVETAGLVFVGPTPEQLRIFGTKHTARDAAQRAGVPMIAGSGLLEDLDAALAAAKEIGYPLMLKATGGGGGIGMAVCRSETELAESYARVARLASSSFGTAGVFAGATSSTPATSKCRSSAMAKDVWSPSGTGIVHSSAGTRRCSRRPRPRTFRPWSATNCTAAPAPCAPP
jgi:urea carboxylase